MLYNKCITSFIKTKVPQMEICNMHSALLHCAIKHKDIFRVLDRINFKKKYTCALVWAILNRQNVIIESLIHKEIDYHLYFDGQTVLHIATRHGNLRDLMSLINNGVNLDVKDCNGYTAAWIAVACNNFSFLEALHGAGACISQVDPDNQTIMHYAAQHAADSCIEYLALHLDCINTQDAYGRTPVYTATRHSNISTVYILEQSGADVTIQTFHGESLLHLACCTNNVYFVLYLLDSIDINIANLEGVTPLTCAIEYSCEYTKYLLEKKGAVCTYIGQTDPLKI